jgi:amidase
MALRIPTQEDLERLAQANHFELNEEELEAFQTLIPGMFQLYEQIERMPEPREPLKYPERDPGYRPSREDDPFNAIIRRCTLKGASTGKLAGKRFGLKNNIGVAGMPMTSGSALLEDYTADADATIVTRLLDAGAEIVALLNLDDLSFSGGGDTSAFGPVLNPHNQEHLSSGSSAGSAAALYYDDIDITIGADQGGSIRMPASWCGVVGHKPTFGLVPYTGIVGADDTVDHVGPMSRTVADAALTLEVIAGKDPGDPRQSDVPVQPYTESLGRGVAGMRIGVLAEGFGLPVSEADVDESVRRAISIFNELGAETTEVSVPVHREAGAIMWATTSEGATALLQRSGMGRHWKGLYNTRLAEALGKSQKTQANDFPPTVKLVLLIGSYLSEQYHGRIYGKAQNLRPGLRAAYDRVLEQVDIIALPTTPMKAHRHVPGRGVLDTISHGWSMVGNTGPFNLTGHPAISIPCGKSNGLPVGLMLVGRHFEDATLFRAAHAFEQHVDWETL